MYQGAKWILLKQKKRSRKSHAWAPLSNVTNLYFPPTYLSVPSHSPEDKVHISSVNGWKRFVLTQWSSFYYRNTESWTYTIKFFFILLKIFFHHGRVCFPGIWILDFWWKKNCLWLWNPPTRSTYYVFRLYCFLISCFAVITILQQLYRNEPPDWTGTAWKH